MSSNSQKPNPFQTWKSALASLATSVKAAFQEVAPNPAPTEPTYSAALASDLPELRVEVAAAHAIVGKAMKWSQPTVWVADNVVPANLQELLKNGLDVIAAGPDKDYHPGTGDKVQALIHPTLFPYIDGVSPILEPFFLPRKIKQVKFQGAPDCQWLATQFSVGKDGSTSIKSYINNLDLSHQDLYKAIELGFSLFLPMFEAILEMRLRSCELQVIVKAVNYVIQPGGERYEGRWHKEGIAHENIVASGIYYYSTSPHLEDRGLAFRQTTRYGQIPIRTPTVEGRLIAFGNVVPHKVAGIVNKSKTEVGICKILAFYLVDPEIEIVSTKHVPEQQWDRVRLLVMTALDEVAMRTIGRVMPTEILLDIMDLLKTGFTLDEARHHRLAMVKRFKVDIDINTQIGAPKVDIDISTQIRAPRPVSK